MTLLTLPWMLLAPLLRALAAEAIPAYSTRPHVIVAGVLVIAMLATFLPVPMALDVGLE